MLKLEKGGEVMDLLWYFLGGMFVFNSLPHLISGIIGNRHMTPLGKDSSAIVNVVWGFVNIAVGVYLISLVTGSLQIVPPAEGLVVYLLGGLVMSLMDANLFSNPNAKMPWWKS